MIFPPFSSENVCGSVAKGRGNFLGLQKCLGIKEISWDCRNVLGLRKFLGIAEIFQLAPLNFSLICYFKIKYYYFNQITQHVLIYSNAHLNPLKGIFSDKLLIIVEILSFQFAEILEKTLG